MSHIIWFFCASFNSTFSDLILSIWSEVFPFFIYIIYDIHEFSPYLSVNIKSLNIKHDYPRSIVKIFGVVELLFLTQRKFFICLSNFFQICIYSHTGQMKPDIIFMCGFTRHRKHHIHLFSLFKHFRACKRHLMTLNIQPASDSKSSL